MVNYRALPGRKCRKCGKRCITEIEMWEHIIRRHPAALIRSRAFQNLLSMLPQFAYDLGNRLGESLKRRLN